MLTITPDTDLLPLIGVSLGSSDWRTVTQDKIEAFANATDDRQWLHVDPVRASDGPFGTTIAHGFLILSLLPSLSAEVASFVGYSAVINYGLDKVRFPAPVPVNARIRDQIAIEEISELRSGLLVAMSHTVGIEGQTRPACVARQLRLLVE